MSDSLPDPRPGITRKDFLNATLLGVGAALLGAPAPAAAMRAAKSLGSSSPEDAAAADAAAAGHAADLAAAGHAADSAAAEYAADQWTGPGGVGDYAASNGNTRAVMDAAHRVRDGGYARAGAPPVVDDVYDLVVVGGGITGLTAAHFFAKNTGGKARCLVLENHPIFGGEAKQNEFDVGGVRLIAPQGSNDFGVPRAGSGWQSDLWDELRMPREFAHAEWGSGPALRAAQDNYQPMEGVGEYGVDVGYFFDEQSGAAKAGWLRNIWQNDLADAPFSDDVKRDLLRWRSTNPVTNGLTGEAYARWLDTMTYRDYLERVMGYGPAVTKMVEPVIGLISGASPDAVSAHAAQQIGMPGVSRARPRTSTSVGLSFPGGNVTYARHLVKALVPDALDGDATFDGVLAGRVRWAALDAPSQPTRVRVGATVVRVQHEGEPGTAPHVNVTYAKDGALHTVRARRVACASGGWITKRVVADLPPEIATAYGEFQYAPALVVNVALTNWRFMAKLGITAARWYDEHGLGFVANLRRPMVSASYAPPFDPEKPAVLTYYAGLYTPGRSAYEQGVLNRARLFATPYADYERTLVAQLTRQFGASGFDARRDVAGVILNRWGHARLVQPPGWYFGRDGKSAPREVVARGFGRVAIGHSELNGHQSATGAMAQGRRLGEEAAAAT